MAGRITVGEKLPFFLYDTPYSAQNRLRDLLAAKSPLVLLFMANFGHPITRTFANRYAETFGALRLVMGQTIEGEYNRTFWVRDVVELDVQP